MNNYFVGQKVKLLTSALLFAVILPGCGNTTEEEKELAVFSSDIADFTSYIREADEKMNALDVSQRESAAELLAILDEMDAEFAAFAQIQTPDQYESVSGLAQQASEEMSLAVSYYHTAYESEEFDENYAAAAYQYYGNSMKAIKYIGLLLTGEDIPEDEAVTVYEITNDEHILDRWLSGNKEDDAAQDALENETASEWTSEAAD